MKCFFCGDSKLHPDSILGIPCPRCSPQPNLHDILLMTAFAIFAITIAAAICATPPTVLQTLFESIFIN